MEENVQHFWHMVCYVKRGKKCNWNAKKKICAMYGEGAVTDKTCQKWFTKFRARDFSLADASWSYRPVEVDSNQIETLIEQST